MSIQLEGIRTLLPQAIEQPLRAYEEIGIRVAFGVGMMEQNHLVLGDDESFLASLPGEVRALARKRLPEPGADLG